MAKYEFLFSCKHLDRFEYVKGFSSHGGALKTSMNIHDLNI